MADNTEIRDGTANQNGVENLYVGVNGKAQQVKKMYVGVNGTAREVKAIYVGVNGRARKVF